MTQSIDKIFNIKSGNPRYWGIIIDNGQYTESEVIDALNAAIDVNEKLDNLREYVFEVVLIYDDENGRDYMGGWDGFETDAHKDLYATLISLNEVTCYLKDNGHRGFPVRTWQRDTKSLARAIDKVSKMAKKLPQRPK